MSDAVIAQNLSHFYSRHRVLDRISFRVGKQDYFVIIGPNGSGKSTLMKMLAGIEPTKSGKLEILGKSITRYTKKALAKKIAFVPQSVPSEFPFSVQQMVLMGRAPHLGFLGIEKPEDMEIARQAMEFTGVDHLSNRKISELSGGERQRAFIARALCQQPQVIVLDEPTASLDLAHQVRVMDLMERLKNDHGVTVIMVSHDVNLAAMYGDTLLLLKDGQIVSLGAPREVLTFQTLEKAYGCTLLVDDSPLGKIPRVTLVPRRYIYENLR